MLGRLRGWYAERAAGWVLAVGACLSIGLVDGMAFWAFAHFVQPLEAELDFSSTDASGIVSLTLLLQAVSSVVAGRLVDRYGPRTILGVGTVGVAAAYLSLAWVREVVQLYALMCVLAVFQSWVLYIPFTTLTTQWFQHRRTTALCIVMSGFNVGGLLFLPLLTELVDAAGWRTAFAVIGVALVAFNGLLVLVIRDQPGESWARGEASTPVDAERRWQPLIEIGSLADALRAPAFWMLSLGFACFYFSYLAFLYHGPLLLEREGIPTRFAALIFSASAGCGLLVRLSCGAWLGRFERQAVVAAVSVLAMVVSLLLLAAGESIPTLTGFVLLWGVGSGVCPTLEPILTGRIFGRKKYATIYGTVEGIGILIAIPAPWLGGLLAEATGTSPPVLFLYSTVLLIGASCFALLARQIPSASAPPLTAPDPAASSKPDPIRVGAIVDVETAGAALLCRLMAEGQQAARAGDRDGAYRRFAHVVRMFPDHEEAWLWRAGTARDSEEVRACLERVLVLNPTCRRARRGLETLGIERRLARLERSLARPDPVERTA